jgi:acyl-CoA thioesterase II
MSEAPIQTLLRRLDLERLDRDRFRGETPNDGRPRVFGGLVAAQALVAADRTVPEGIRPHSLHSYFLRPGDPTRPIIYEVDRIRDGKSFTTRRVVAIQEGEAIYSAAISFHKDESGLSHQMEMPESPPPEHFPTNRERLVALAERSEHPVFKFLLALDSPIEHRDPEFVDPLNPEPHRGLKRLWFKPSGPMPDASIVHAAVMTYATDVGLLDNCIQWHGLTWMNPKLQAASLDHAIWFHREARLDDFHLYAMESPSAEGSRGFNLGRIYDRAGKLVASVAQESLMRLRE